MPRPPCLSDFSWSTKDNDIIQHFSQTAETNSPLQPASGPPEWWLRPARRNTHILEVTRLPCKVLSLFPPPTLHSLQVSPFCCPPTEHEETGSDCHWLCRRASTPWGKPALLFLTDLGHLIWTTQPAVGRRTWGRHFNFCRFDDLPSPDPTASLPTLPSTLLDRRPPHYR
jgi:hypothetical protein